MNNLFFELGFRNPRWVLLFNGWVIGYASVASVAAGPLLFTPRACIRGKAIGFICLLSVYCCHENRQIATSRRLSDS